jgi:hypothetical protein
VIDKRTTRHPGYAASQRIRKRIEETFGIPVKAHSTEPDHAQSPVCAWRS